MNKIKSKFISIILLSFIWFLLTYPPDLQEWIAGGCLILFLILLPFESPYYSDIKLHPKAFFYCAAYIFVFLFELVKSNLDVAFRVLHPVIPINPGIVRIRTKLKSRLGRLVLANSITLTPGTITVDTSGENFYIHWINIHGKNSEEMTREIAAKFERYLEVIFG